MTKANGSISVNLYPAQTGMSIAKLRNGGLRGLIMSIDFWKAKISISASTIGVTPDKGLTKFQLFI